MIPYLSLETTQRRACLIAALLASITGTSLHALFGYSWVTGSGHAFGSDDAFISYRYAANLFAGHGLVFNPGERVEGYSNFLYTLLVTPAMALGHDYVYPFSVVLNATLLGLSLWMFWRYAHARLDAFAANAGVLLLGINPWLWANAASGLETALVLAITVGTWIALEAHRQTGDPRELRRLALLAVLAILSRVDGFLLPLLAAAYLALHGRFGAALRLAGVVAGAMALYTAARLVYYDDVIANTYYNKVSGELVVRLADGLAFYRQEAIKTWLLPAVVFGAAQALLALARCRTARGAIDALSFPVCFTAAWSAYLIYIGGDIYYERFLAAAIPLALFVTLAATASWPRPARTVVLAVLAVLPLLHAFGDGRFAYRHPRYDMWVETGKFLGERHPGTSVAVDAAGKVPFFSGLHTIDMLGLNDKHIGKMAPQSTGMPGHTKYDPQYVVSRRPDFIAAAIAPSLDMGWGMTRDHYRLEYRLQYLVNASRDDLGERNIVNVDALSPQAVTALIEAGHEYGILRRRDEAEQAAFLATFPLVRPGAAYGHAAQEALFLGWSYAESTHRWSLGTQSKLVFLVDDPAAFAGELTLELSPLGRQTVSAALNGRHIVTSALAEAGAWTLSLPPGLLRAGRNELELTLPDARRPGNGDPRILAVALRSFTLH